MQRTCGDITCVLTGAHEVVSFTDATVYLTRLRTIDDAFDQIKERMNASAAIGIVPPDFITDKTITAIRNIIKGKPFDNSARDNFVYKDFVDKVNAAAAISVTQRNSLFADVQQALLNDVKPAYENFVAYLQNWKNQASDVAGAWQFRIVRRLPRRQLRAVPQLQQTEGEVTLSSTACPEHLYARMAPQ